MPEIARLVDLTVAIFIAVVTAWSFNMFLRRVLSIAELAALELGNVLGGFARENDSREELPTWTAGEFTWRRH